MPLVEVGCELLAPAAGAAVEPLFGELADEFMPVLELGDDEVEAAPGVVLVLDEALGVVLVCDWLLLPTVVCDELLAASGVWLDVELVLLVEGVADCELISVEFALPVDCCELLLPVVVEALLLCGT